MFEKVSENPVRHLYHGRVQLVDYELNYRPQKDKREFDFYLKLTGEKQNNIGEKDSGDDLAPGRMREVKPESRKIPDAEERISYESDKQSQAEAANEHEDTVGELRDCLKSGRWECWETVETDILATSDYEALVIEVKSIDGENQRNQLRKALGQVFENSYRDVKNRGWGEKELIPCLAFSQVPSDRFSGYLEFLQSEGIEVLWRSEEGISGHPDSLSRIL